METINKRLQDGFMKKKVSEIDDAVSMHRPLYIEYPGELYCTLRENLGMEITVLGKVVNDDCNFRWYHARMHNRRHIKCTGFESSQLPVSSTILQIFKAINIDEEDECKVPEGQLWTNRIDFIGDRCVATVADIESPNGWRGDEPRLLVKLESKPGEIAMFSTSAKNFGIKYEFTKIISMAGEKAGNLFLFKDGDYVEIPGKYIPNLARMFEDFGDIIIPAGDIMRNVARDRGMSRAAVVDSWDTNDFGGTIRLSAKITGILGKEPEIIDGNKLGWRIRIGEDWDVNVM